MTFFCTKKGDHMTQIIPIRKWSIYLCHGTSWPQLWMSTRFIIHHFSALLVSKQGDGGELMSRQIEVRVFECSQLEEETFRSSYHVSQSLIWCWGGVGASLSNGDTPSSFPCFLSKRNENLSRWKMFVCYSPVSGMNKCQRGVSHFTASCYT